MTNRSFNAAFPGNRSVFRFPTPSSPMPFTGERYVSGLFGDIQSEHYHRYLFALRNAWGLDVLDVASGEGFGSALLGQVAQSVIGVDLDVSAVRFANENYLSDRVSFRRGDATALPIADRSVDLVVSFETIEHLDDHQGFVAEIRRVLRPGGLLIISSPDRKIYSEEAQKANPFHVRELGRLEFLEVLRQSFTNVSLFEQRAIAGSIIARTAETGSVGGVEGFTTHDGLTFELSAGVPDCPYLIAVASDAELQAISHSVMHTPRWIWHIEEMRQRAEKRADDANAEIPRLSEELTKAAAERDLRGAEIDRLSEELANATAERDPRGAKIDRLSEELANAATERDLCGAEIDRLSEELANAAAERDLRGAKIDRLSEELAAKEAALAEASRPLRKLAVKLRQAAADHLSFRPFSRKRGLPKAVFLEASELTRTGGIDIAWYLASNPDVVESGMAPALHYVVHGRAEGRSPRPPSGNSEVLAQSGVPTLADGQREWLTYGSMAQRIAEDRLGRLRAVQPKPIAAISLQTDDLNQVAEDLDFRQEEQPLVSIIVPVFNNLQLTMECLISIQRQTDSRTPFEIIIADDASTDESKSILPRIRNSVYVRNEENVGFLMNCNRAARVARGEFLLFLNNDVQVTEGWLAALVEPFSTQANVGAVGPRIVYPSGHLQEAGGLVNPDGSTELIGLNDAADSLRYGFARRVDYCSGACLILRREVFAEVGGFTESLRPAYCEDLDLCLKLRERGLEIWYSPRAVILHHLSKSTDALGSAYKMRCILANRQKIAERWHDELDAMNRVRLFAFYLPQFHPIAENNRWWGQGFTEWANVARARPQYDGHWQPKLPADLGFYDLRRPEVLVEQANLARRYGVGGFCFYYYWFGGKRLLESPLEAMLSSGKPDFPFLLCWANENWTRKWDGKESDILISQSHSDEDDVAVIYDLMRYFRDSRYVRVNGRPMLLVYRVALFPSFSRTATIWRELCRSEGIGEIYLAAVASFEAEETLRTPESFGCDAVVQFPPHGRAVRASFPSIVDSEFRGSIFDYEESVLNYLRQPLPAAPYFPGVMPSWDNTARQMSKGTIFKGATPGAFQAWLEEAIRLACEHNSGDERIVFINAWNEWAEGAYIEPDTMFGHANLEAVRNALLAHSLKTD